MIPRDGRGRCGMTTGDDRGWDEWCFVILALPISLPRSGQGKGMSYDARNPRV